MAPQRKKAQKAQVRGSRASAVTGNAAGNHQDEKTQAWKSQDEGTHKSERAQEAQEIQEENAQAGEKAKSGDKTKGKNANTHTQVVGSATARVDENTPAQAKKPKANAQDQVVRNHAFPGSSASHLKLAPSLAAKAVRNLRMRTYSAALTLADAPAAEITMNMKKKKKKCRVSS